MRVLNLKDFKDDVDTRLRVSRTSQEDAYIAWVMSHYFKDLVTDKSSQFLFKVSHSASMLGMETDLMTVRFSSTSLPKKLYAETEWDIKDAKAGNLFYYSPTQHSLTLFRSEISNIRDYVYSLLLENPKEDLRRRNRDDMRRASEEWHRVELAHLTRILQEAEEYALRTKQESQFVNVYGTDTAKFGREEDIFTISGVRYTLVRLLTPQALANESLYMEHCVHGYTSQLLDPNHVLLSLRTVENLDLPCVTIHLNQLGDPRLGTFELDSLGQSWFWEVQSKAKYNENPDYKFPGFNRELSRVIRSWNADYSSFRELISEVQDKSCAGDQVFKVKS